MKKPSDDLCQSFRPVVDERSRVLVLGSMPGPVALRKRQYYGFDGNHFWFVIPALFGLARPEAYEDRIGLVREKGIALWDVLDSCVRPGALDSAIREAVPNKIPELLRQHPGIRAIFINGRFAYNTFVKAFGAAVDRPYFYLPSTSPAHAAMSLEQKIKAWRAIRDYLNDKPAAGPRKAALAIRS